MRILYQKKLSPFCFKVRILLDEKNLEYHTINKGRQHDINDVRQMDPSGNLPILLEEKDTIIAHHQAICEYLDEKHKIGLLGTTPIEKANVRRMCFWADEKLYNDVVRHLLNERVFKLLEGSSSPNGRTISTARANLDTHLRYFSHLLNSNDFIASNFLSLADICIASHLAVLDYIGEVSWDKFKDMKDWYSVIKSRKSFQSILKERMDNILPSPHYSNLDF